MTRVRERLPLSLALLVAGAVSCVPATNPYDAETPTALQAAATLEGRAAFPSVSGEAPRLPDGIVVQAQRVGSPDVLEVVTSSENTGRFRFEVQPGEWIVSATHPDFDLASVGPLRLSPGAELDVGVLELRLGVADMELSGTVVAQGGASAGGVEVSLVHELDDGSCGATEAKTTTDASGNFLFEAVRRGLYTVVARTEGATVAVQKALRLDVDDGEPAELSLTDPLVITAGTQVVQIESDGVRPTETTRLRDVLVHVLEFGEMAEMQIGADPTFDPAYGATGWQPFASSAPFQMPDAEGEWRVFVQLRSSCVTSPLYAAPLIYDATPPAIITAQGGTTQLDPLDPEVRTAVVSGVQAGAAVSLNVLDTSGIARVRFVLDGDVANGQVEEADTEPGQSIIRATADIPVEEGRYRMSIIIEDKAGNTTGALSPVVDVLRDGNIPTTPIPTVENLEVTGPRAVVWLEQRDCADGTRAPVCEANPHPDGLYLVRGGPELLEFTAIPGPPFEVRLHDSVPTSIQILAQDAAGNVSPGVGRVEVTRTQAREVFRAPIGKELGAPVIARSYHSSLDGFVEIAPADLPPIFSGDPLYAAGGTAFFALRASESSPPPYFSYLVAQPADLPDVGLDPKASAYPDAIRKLNQTCNSYNCVDVYNRPVGGFGAGGGAITWMERISGTSSPARPMRHVLWADGDGRFNLRGPENVDLPSGYIDHTDEPGPSAFHWDACRDRGSSECAIEPWAWVPFHQRGSAETFFDGKRLLSSGAAQDVQRLIGSDEGTRTIVGPAVIGSVIQSRPGSQAQGWPLLTAMAVRMALSPGDVVYGTVYELDSESAPTAWNPSTFDSQDYFVPHVATGDDVEVFNLPPNVSAYDHGRLALAVVIPEGVTATVPVIGPVSAPGKFDVHGLLDFSRTQGTLFGDLVFGNAEPVSDPTRSLDLSIFSSDRDAARLGTLTGLSLTHLGSDGRLQDHMVRHEDLEADPTIADRLAEDISGQLVAERQAVTALPTASADNLVIPDGGCSVIFSPKTDLHLRGIRVEGAGLLDQLGARIYARSDDSSVGRYSLTYLNPYDFYYRGTQVEFYGPDAEDCEDITPTPLATASATDNATIAEVVNDSIDIDTQAPLVLQNLGTWSGVADNTLNPMLYVELDPPAQGLAIPPGARIRATTTGTAGDADLYVRFEQLPLTYYYDCRGYTSGSDEECYAIADDTDTTVYVGIKGYYEPSDFVLNLDVVEPELRQVASYPVQAGDLIHTDAIVVDGNPDLYLRLGEEPTLDDYDCRSTSYYYDEDCDLLADADTTVYVAIREREIPSTYNVSTTIKRPNFFEVGTWDVQPTGLVHVDLTSTSETAPYVRDDVTGVWTPMDCDDDAGTLRCDLFASPLATEVTVGVAAQDVDTDFTADVDVSAGACSEVEGSGYSGIRFAGTGLLREGQNYLVVLGDMFGADPAEQWPEEGPAIYAGAAASTVDMDVVGSAASITRDYASEGYVVDQVDTLSPVCRVSFDVSRTTRYQHPTLGEDIAAAARWTQGELGLPEWSMIIQPVDQFDSFREVEPTVVRDLEPGWWVEATAAVGDRVFWLETDPEHRRPRVWSSATATWPPEAPCDVGELAGDLEVFSAEFDDGRLAVVSLAAGARQLQVFEVSDTGACGEVTEVLRQGLDTLPRAAALSREDLFLWTEQAGTGGVLRHVSLRDLVPLHPGGRERVVGFDSRAGETLIALSESPEDRAGRVVMLRTDPSSGRVQGSEALTEDTLRLSPRFFGAGFASLRAGPPDAQGEMRPEVVLRPIDPATAGMVGDVVLASSAAYFAGAPIYDPSSALRWARTPILEVHGQTMVVLGWTSAGERLLTIFDVPADPTSWSGVTSSLEAVIPTDEADISSLFVDDGIVGVTYADALLPARVFRRVDGTTWGVVASSDFDDERVVGAIDGSLVLLKNPGELFADKPPPHAPIALRDPAAVDDSTDLHAGFVPSGTYTHLFGYVGTGVAGDLSLYDVTASDGVLWRLDPASGMASRDDGALRPLTSGAGGLGDTALPRSDGDSLYFLRRLEAGIALMRYRRLQP
jgi:hypothetical protein